jgi:uncharacterized protein (TIGR03435 family)
MRGYKPGLILAGILVSTACCLAQGPAGTLSFEVASIKPSAAGTRTQIAALPGGRFVANGVRMTLMVAAAFHVLDYQIIGAPDWFGKDQWNIEAIAAEGNIDQRSSKPAFLNVPVWMAPALRSLLEDRCELKTHLETREMQVYALTVATGGSKLKSTESPMDTPSQTSAPPPGARPRVGADGALPANFAPPRGATVAGPGVIRASSMTMDQIAILLGRLLDRPLVDSTSLTGYFDVRLEFDPATAPRAALRAPAAAPWPDAQPSASDPAGPSLFKALQEQLGLKLDLRKQPVEVLVVDSVHKPTSN